MQSLEFSLWNVDNAFDWRSNRDISSVFIAEKMKTTSTKIIKIFYKLKYFINQNVFGCQQKRRGGFTYKLHL